MFPIPDDSDHLEAIETRLVKMVPSRSGLDADRMLFDAGRAAGSKRCRAWQLVAAATVLIASGMGMVSLRERQALQVAERERSVLAGQLLALRGQPKKPPVSSSQHEDVVRHVTEPTREDPISSRSTVWTARLRTIESGPAPRPRSTRPVSHNRPEPPLSPLSVRDAKRVLQL